MSDVTRSEQWTKYVTVINETIDNPIVIRKGRYGGTWLHIDMLEEFLRSLMQPLEFHRMRRDNVLTFTRKEIEKKSVYIILCDDDVIKVGISSDTKRRFKELTANSGRTIVDFVVTDPLASAYQIEQFLLAYFDDYRINGEWLKDLDFNRVVAKLQDVIGRTYLNENYISNQTIKIVKEGF